MNLLPRRCLLAIAAVVDIAIHARPSPVAAKALAARNDLPPRHLETLLQSLVRAQILKGVRGPRGGYELARERRRISVAEIVRASTSDPALNDDPKTETQLMAQVILPFAGDVSDEILAQLEQTTVADLCEKVTTAGVFSETSPPVDFTI